MPKKSDKKQSEANKRLNEKFVTKAGELKKVEPKSFKSLKNKFK